MDIAVPRDKFVTIKKNIESIFKHPLGRKEKTNQ